MPSQAIPFEHLPEASPLVTAFSARTLLKSSTGNLLFGTSVPFSKYILRGVLTAAAVAMP
jgi:hypothetical protein